MKIHFGAFNRPVDGWVNTDITPHLFVARVPGLAWAMRTAGVIPASRYEDYTSGAFRKLRYLDVSKHWPFADESVEAIFSSHVLEHLTLRAARACLHGAHRVLQRGGVLRVVVPDLDRCVAGYTADTAFEWARDVFEADQASEKNMHHFMYNLTSLSKLLAEAGFADIKRVGYHVGQCPDIDKLDNRPDSLFVEAVK